jgi:hypothetical protein
MIAREQEIKQKDKTVSMLVDQFDYWMKHYDHEGRGHYEDNNKALVDWLSYDSGANDVKNYEKFCELASELHKKGYATNPPPSESDFSKGVSEYEARESSGREKSRAYCKDWRPNMFGSRGQVVQSATTVAISKPEVEEQNEVEERRITPGNSG